MRNNVREKRDARGMRKNDKQRETGSKERGKGERET